MTGSDSLGDGTGHCTDGTDRISRGRAEKDRGLLEMDYASPCADCGGVVFGWWDSDTCRDCEDSNSETTSEQTTLITDGGTVEDETERTVTCQNCYLTYDKHDIDEGQITYCPRCERLVVA